MARLFLPLQSYSISSNNRFSFWRYIHQTFVVFWLWLLNLNTNKTTLRFLQQKREKELNLKVKIIYFLSLLSNKPRIQKTELATNNFNCTFWHPGLCFWYPGLCFWYPSHKQYRGRLISSPVPNDPSQMIQGSSILLPRFPFTTTSSGTKC